MSRIKAELWYNRFKERRKRCVRRCSFYSPEYVNKWIKHWSTEETTISEVANDVGVSFGSCQVIFKHILGMKRVDCSKIAKFWAKTSSHGHYLGDVNGIQRWSSFAVKGYNWWRIMNVLLRHWNQSPAIPMEASRRAKTERSTSSSVTVFFEFFGQKQNHNYASTA